MTNCRNFDKKLRELMDNRGSIDNREFMDNRESMDNKELKTLIFRCENQSRLK